MPRSAGRDDQRRRQGRHPLVAPGEPEAVGRRRGDRDGGADRLGQGALGLRAPAGQLRSGADDLHRDVADLEACGTDPSRGLGEQRAPRCTGPLRLAGPEVAAQVTETRGGGFDVVFFPTVAARLCVLDKRRKDLCCPWTLGDAFMLAS